MTTHRQTQPSILRSRAEPRASTARSRFAKRGQSHEERMPDDDSAQKFQDGERPLAPAEGRVSAHGRLYGAGGSYGYGGAFEHGGQRGYEVSFAEPRREAEDGNEATGGVGHDTSGYGRQGIGHPGKDERRPAPVTDGAPASGHPEAPEVDDARHGYSQESGYAQSGGNPTPGSGKDGKKGARTTN